MKIRGNTIGTPIKPEKNILKATDLTEEEKAQARENIGACGTEEVQTLINTAISNIPDYNGEVEDV